MDSKKETVIEIRISWQSAIIILLAVLVFLMGTLFGAYFYRGYQMQAHVNRYNQTLRVFSQLDLNPQVAQVLRNIGWPIREVRSLPQVLPQREIPPEPEQNEEGE